MDMLLMVVGELHMVKFIILLSQAQQLVMPAFFHDPAVDDNHDSICIPDSTEPMGDDKGRAALH
jgi:hypothetical protein